MKNFTIAIVLSLLLILAACTSSTQNSGTTNTGNKEKLKFGVMMPLSGDAASYGNPLSNAYKLALDEINAAGGIAGRQVELVFEDSKCTPNDGATAAQKLVSIDQVKVILGGACSGETLGAAPITEAAKVILLSPTSSSPKITTAGDFVFRTYSSDANAGRIAADKAYEMGFKKAALITETTDYAQSLRETFKNSFRSKGGQIVADETYSSEMADFRTLILKIKSSNPDVVYIVPQTYQKAVLMIKQLKEQGLDAQLMTAEILTSDLVVSESGNDIGGIIGFEAAFDPNNPKSADFIAKYKAKFNEELAFPFFQAGAYDDLYLIKEAIEANNGIVDTIQIRDYLYNVKDWEGALGTLTIDSNGDAILSYIIKKVENGRSKVIGHAS